jgi:hypothetical protein
MSKSNIRKSKSDKSTLRKIERAIKNGWQPGLRPADFYRGSARNRREAAGRVI